MYAIERNGNRGGIAELFALGPSDLTLSNMRRQIWMSGAFGINRYLLAISQLDLRVRISEDSYHTDTMTAWLSSFSPSQPWFPHISILGESAKKAARFALKERAPLVNVIYPYKILPVNMILNELVEKQITWNILGEGEKPTAKYFLKWGDCGSVLSGNIEGWEIRPLDTLQSIAAAIAAANPDRTRVTLPDGMLAPDIFLQLYKDGSVLAVDFSGKERELVLVRDGEKYPFTMYPAGVIALEKGENPLAPDNPTFVKNADGKWKVILNKPNTMRPDFGDAKAVGFTIESPMEITFAIRQYGGTPKLLLDGEELSVTQSCIVLPEGFKNLYAQKRVKLEAGMHVLKLENDAVDYPYMPLIFITGNFSEEKDVLRPYKDDGVGLFGYVGKLTQICEMKIPEKARFVSVDTGDLTSEFFIDGVSQGVKMWPPFKWEIPFDLAGKTAKVELVRYTSLGRLFGDFNFFKKVLVMPKFTRILREFRPANDGMLAPYCPISFEN